MSKKGRVGGTIGFILSLAIVGGTVAFSAMFNPYASAKSKKPVGDATGNVVTAYTKKEGFTETKKLVEDTFGRWFAPVETGAKYKSFSMDFNISLETTVTADKKTVVQNVDYDGSVYSDELYTYLKMNASGVDGSTVSSVYTEMFYSKKSGECFTRALAYAQNPQDSAMINEVEWAESTDVATGDSSVLDFVDDCFSTVSLLFQNEAGWEFDYVSGLFKLDEEAKQNGAEYRTSATFTVGFNPRVMLTVYTADDKKENVVSEGISFSYSNLNNTVVNVPETLKSKVGA